MFRHFPGQRHKVTTIVVRLSQEALDEYLDAKGWGETSADFDSHDEWLAHCVTQTAKMEEFKDKVCRTFGVNRNADGYSGSVTQNVSEIFTVLLYNKDGGKALSGLTSRRKAERELYLTEVTKDMDTLRKGDEGKQVTVLQILLNAAFQRNLDTDGKFGTKTQTAVEDYQTEKGLESDGICGPLTWEVLLADCG